MQFHQQEAEIVASAGRHKSVVVATNMAWRETDIVGKMIAWKSMSRICKTSWTCYKMRHICQKDPQWVSYTVYSGEEYDSTIEGMKTVFWITDEQVRQATWQWVNTDTCRFKITLNTAKKERHKWANCRNYDCSD